MNIFSPVISHLASLSWSDMIEITVFSALFYYVALWLKKDSHKNMLLGFYGYCSVWGISYLAGFVTISSFLIAYSPLILTLLVIGHQHSLQKNLVALHKIQARKQPASNWVEAMMRTILVTINDNKSITCLIERSDDLSNLIQAPFLIQAPVSEQLLTMVMQNNAFDDAKMVWLGDTGTLMAINSQWNHALETPVSDKKATWYEDALLFTAKTDAIMIHADAESRLFTIISDGSTYEQLMATQARDLITRILSPDTSNQGETNASRPEKHRSDQLAN